MEACNWSGSGARPATGGVLNAVGYRRVDESSARDLIGICSCWSVTGSRLPATLVTDLDEMVQRLIEAGQDVSWDAGFPGFRRVFVQDPFGNRLEFLQPSSR